VKILSGAVYMTKSRGPRAEPWGHHRDKCVDLGLQEIRLFLHIVTAFGRFSAFMSHFSTLV